MRGFLILIIILALASFAAAQLSVPEQVTAGAGITIKASDDVLVFGPGTAFKKKPASGEVSLSG